MVSILVPLINVQEGAVFTKVTGNAKYHYHGQRVVVGDTTVLASDGTGFISSCNGGLRYHGMNLQTLVRFDFNTASEARSFLDTLDEEE